MLNSVSLVSGCYLEAVWYCELVITCDAELGLGPRDMVRAITGALKQLSIDIIYNTESASCVDRGHPSLARCSCAEVGQRPRGNRNAPECAHAAQANAE